MANHGKHKPDSDRFDFAEKLEAGGNPAVTGGGEIAPDRANGDSEHPAAMLDTRGRLVEAARDLFLRQGYHRTGIKQILAQAGANSGSLYHYFPTKEDLLLAVLEFYVDMLQPLVIQPVFDRVSDPIERIFGILDSYRRMLQYTHCAQGCPIGNLALELSDTHDNVRSLVSLNFTNWKNAIEQCLVEGADRLPDDCDRAQLASFVLTVMEGGVMQARAYKSLEPFESAVALLRDYFDQLFEQSSDWSSASRHD
jgi:AcrR family transcriptional regulator